MSPNAVLLGLIARFLAFGAFASSLTVLLVVKGTPGFVSQKAVHLTRDLSNRVVITACLVQILQGLLIRIIKYSVRR